MRRRVIIMGAGGRDFHNFNMVFRSDPEYEVVAFTATQIPFIANRRYPPELAGPLYPDGIPIYPEGELKELIKRYNVNEVVFSYSDCSHEYVMHRASLCLALGCDFSLLGPERTSLKSERPVISICAVRTGCGKSSVTRYVAGILKERGLKPVVIRHPMAYTDLSVNRCQRFGSRDDLERAGITIEEREEFEHLIELGVGVYSGVDYKEILKKAEDEGEVLLWDGGNNDFPFLVSNLNIVLFDPHRPGHEVSYHPGETNLLRADIAVINKVDTADKEDIERVERNIRALNPLAKIVKTNFRITTENPELIKGKRVLVVEDGPTLTHGGMSYGAGMIAARRFGAGELVDPRPYAEGSIKDVFKEYPHIGNLLPAMGYSPEQIKELKATIENTPCDICLIATPVDLKGMINLKKEAIRVRYEIEETYDGPTLKGCIEDFLKG